MDFVPGRGYAIGDDGTALRTDDGGATWTGLADRHLAGPRAACRPSRRTSSSSSAATAASCAAPTTAARRSARCLRPDRDQLPGPVAASYFVTPQVGYLLLRDGNVLRTTDAGRRFSRVTAIPGTPGSAGGGNGDPADAIFTTPDAGIVFLTGSNTAFRTTDAGALVDARARRRARQRAADAAPSSATTFYAFGPDTLLRSATPARPGSGPASGGSTITGIELRDARPLPAHDRPRRPPAADRERRATAASRSPPPPRRSTPPASPTPPARSRPAAAARPSSPTTAGATTRRSAATSRARSSSACGSGRRRTSRSRSAPAASSPARPTTASRGRRSTSPPPPTCATRRSRTADDGYALDERGGLFRTVNGGASWQPIDPGTTSRAAGRDHQRATSSCSPARAASGAPPAAAQFNVVTAKAARDARVDQFDRAGIAIFAYGANAIVRTHEPRQPWTAVKGPTRKRARDGRAALRDLDMTSANGGYALDTAGRVWRTTNGGKRWTRAAPRSAPTAASRSRSARPTAAT